MTCPFTPKKKHNFSLTFSSIKIIFFQINHEISCFGPKFRGSRCAGYIEGETPGGEKYSPTEEEFLQCRRTFSGLKGNIISSDPSCKVLSDQVRIRYSCFCFFQLFIFIGSFSAKVQTITRSNGEAKKNNIF